MMKTIEGVLPPLVTPFENNKVSIDAFNKNIMVLRRFNIGGFVVLGSTGEAPLLREIEKVQLIKAARVVTPDDEVLIIGTGMETVDNTVRMSNIAAEYGADALLVLTPHYYRSQMTDEALETFYLVVADRARAPVIIYNIPQLTGVNISPDVVARLAKHENIIGLKDSSGSLSYMLELCSAAPEQFFILCGSASVFVPSLLAGAVGGVLGIANVLPEPCVAMNQLMRENKPSEAAALQRDFLPAVKLIMGELGIPGIKAGMNMRGLSGGEPRPPLLPCGDSALTKLRRLLDQLVDKGIIPDVALKS